jgi:hypothetical protein
MLILLVGSAARFMRWTGLWGASVPLKAVTRSPTDRIISKLPIVALRSIIAERRLRHQPTKELQRQLELWVVMELSVD